MIKTEKYIEGYAWAKGEHEVKNLPLETIERIVDGCSVDFTDFDRGAYAYLGEKK